MKSDTSPARRTLANRAFFILAVLGGLFLAGISHAANVTATFNSAADIPVTANGYTATGNTLDVTLNFAPAPGTNLTVVRNTALTFINGTFDNVANGATVNLTFNGTTYTFVAWYYGGAGRDLVLLWPYTGIAAWGYNAKGQLGDNSTTDRLAPISVDQSGVLAGKTVVQIACGRNHTLALTTEGKVYAWGFAGLLGNNTGFSSHVPVAVNTDTGTSALFGKTVVAISAGIEHSIALCSDGTLVTWGENNSGQLGDNTTTYRSAPVAVNTTSGVSALFGKAVVAISAGLRHNLALCSDGTLVTWGYNFSGQLGDNTTTTRTAPVTVNTTSGTSALFGRSVIAVSAGFYFSLALCSDGTVVGWGSNDVGQLGDNTTTDRSVPVSVNTTSGTSALFGKTITSIAAGARHNLALCSDGTLAAWGYSGYGALGNNTTIPSNAPVAVNTASGVSALFGKTVIAISAGDEYSLALCSDNTVAAWGLNENGRLGENTATFQRNVPVSVNTTNGTSALFGKTATSLRASSSIASHSAVIYTITPPTIEVEVLEPTPTSLSNNASTVDYGSTQYRTRTFRIKNTWDLPLTGLAVSVAGADASDFVIVNQPTSVVSGGGSSTFQVIFAPGSAGVKNTTLQIANTTPGLPPFVIALTGTRPTFTVYHVTFNAADDIAF